MRGGSVKSRRWGVKRKPASARVNAGLRLTPLRRNRIDPPQVVVVSVTIDWDRSVVSLCLASLPVWVQVEGQRLQPAFSLVDDSFLLGCSVCDCGATADPELL